jgi:1-acyl-sn-glycerol-3-phosphate acyltransferase
MLEYIEPKRSDVLMTLVKWIWPLYVKIRYGELKIMLGQEVLDDFKKLTSKPLIICPNHSAPEDPDILFGISRLVGERFNFLAAREIFKRGYNFGARWLQKLGCYSVERGATDIQAFKATQELLLGHNNKVVIFPEGEASHQNDFLLPLENGAEHIALATLEELKRVHPDQSIYILPIVLKYRYSSDIRPVINVILDQVSELLGQSATPGELLTAKLKRLYDAFLNSLERTHSLPGLQGGLNERLFALREQLILEAEAFLHVELPNTWNQLHRMHILKNKFTELRWGVAQDKKTERKTKKAASTERYEATKVYHQLELAINLLAVGEYRFDHDLTQEEAAELATLLALEVCKMHKPLKSPDIVLVGTSKPIDVSDYEEGYRQDKRQAIELLKLELQHRLETRLIELERSYFPIMAD